MATSSNDPDALGRLPDYKYLYVSNTNVSNFVSVKLCGACNYQIWKTQIMCLMEAHDMLGLVDEGSIDSSMKDMAKYDSLLKGWIFGSVSEDVLRIVVDSKSSAKAKDVWNTLKRYFNATTSSDDQQDSTPTKTDTNTDSKDKNVVLEEIPTNEKCGNSTESEAKGEATTQTETEEQKNSNQLLLRKQTLREILAEAEINDKDISSADSESKREDTTQPETKDSAPIEVDKKIERKAENGKTETKSRLPKEVADDLKKAIKDDDWDDVCFLLLRHRDAIKEQINGDDDGNTALHIAVGIGRNDVIRRVLMSRRNDELTVIRNSDESTFLHIAAIVGNTDAAEFLVWKDANLLHTIDKDKNTPLDIAVENMQLHTIAYLLEAIEKEEKKKKDAEDQKRKKDAEDQKRPKDSEAEKNGKKAGRVEGGKKKAANGERKDKGASDGKTLESVPGGNGKGKEAAADDGKGKEEPDDDRTGEEGPDDNDDGKRNEEPDVDEKGDEVPDVDRKGDEEPNVDRKGHEKPDGDGKGHEEPDVYGNGHHKPSNGKGHEKPDVDEKGHEELDVDEKGHEELDVDGKGHEEADVNGKGHKEADVNGKGHKEPDVEGKGHEEPDVDGKDKEASKVSEDSHLPRVEIGAKVLVNAISAKEYEFALKLVKGNSEYAVLNDEVLMAIARTFPIGLDYVETFFYPNLDNLRETMVKRSKYLFNLLVNIYHLSKDVMSSILSCEDGFKEAVGTGVLLILVVPAAMVYWIFHLILLLLLMVYFPFFMLYFLFWKVAIRVVSPIRSIEQKKKEFDEAKKVLELVCAKIYETDANGHEKIYKGPILEAACQNAYEVVVEILKKWPKAIRCKDENGYDIIQLATIHRSEKIYNLIYMIGDRKIIYRTKIDSSMNNMLHLAGRLAPSNKLKLRTGAALQLQRELQWREEVKKLVFPSYTTKENIFKDTPDMVFTKEHENLVKEGEKWIKTVAESCSITAALITTIVFAAAITVPGGSSQEGVPVFMKEVAFTIFAIADAISLFSSATALLVFLSILTARFAEQDFLVRLPRRMIIGLCTLLLSTTSMMVAFGATLFLVFCHDKLWMLAPLCGLAFFPIAIFFILQFPLIVDLFRSTYISNFGKSNHNSSKFNPNDIRFFFGK